LMLPSGLSQQADVLYQLNVEHGRLGELPPVAQRLVTLLAERGPLRGRQIDRHFQRVDWRKTAQSLARRGVLAARSVLPPPGVRPKMIRMAQLAVPPEQVEAALPHLGATPATRERRARALRFLMEEPDAVAVTWVYAHSGCTLADLQELAERDLIRLWETEIFRDPLAVRQPAPTNAEITLTPDQEAVLTRVLAAFDAPNVFLLHGVTGSGKTEIYLRAAAEAIRRGRQAIILVPEIALTPQTVRRFLARFPGQVGMVHSKLSPGERYDTWRRARSGQLQVIIGARSALFAPLPNIGLIVADECHDPSYHQSDPPAYDAIAAAQDYARLCGAVCLLGSATPPVALRHQAEGGKIRLLELTSRLTPLGNGRATPGADLPPVSIVDMREELKAGTRGIFSRALEEALAAVLERGEQAILYLNRRGTATHVFCRDCGHVMQCPQCETPLTYHTDLRTGPRAQGLTCHHCGYTRQKPKTCPACKSPHIREYGLGSEKVEADVKALFPTARVLRWDWDTTREKDAHEMILTHFANHQADVLVGTQMLAKGLDLPLVTLVGIVLADVGLNLPDPFGSERAFQLLTQVAGRAGRSARGGRVILQTFQPEHPVVQEAARHDYAAFYAREIESRRMLGYPPFARLARLEFRHADEAHTEAACRQMTARLQERIRAEGCVQTSLIGPAPCFFAKQDGLYRWQVIVRGPDPASLLRGLRLDGWRVDVDPISLL
ncbi:MAG: primosomal protein N', partial [Anaerolineales bacterium]